mgnify:CR=1 FL=1
MSLILDKINYVYSEGTAYQIQALKDVNLGDQGRTVYRCDRDIPVLENQL